MSTELLEELAPQELLSDRTGKYAHIVEEGFFMKDDEGERGEFVPLTPVVDGMIFQTPLRALCGYEWIATDDPLRYQVCPKCVEVAHSLGWKVPTF